jgi:hypothetical protein
MSQPPPHRRQTVVYLLKLVLVTAGLLLLAIGVLEALAVLEGYLALDNVSYEAARFAARPVPWDPQLIRLHTEDTLAARRLPVYLGGSHPNATLIITRFEFDMGLPCDPWSLGNPACNDFCANPPCDCSAPDKREPTYADDDVIVLPPPPPGDMPFPPTARVLSVLPTAEGRPTPPPIGSTGPTLVISEAMRITYGLGPPRHTTRIGQAFWQKYAEQLNVINCQSLSQQPPMFTIIGQPVVVELFYDQPQLFGVPPVSNPWTDPFPLYARTSMRLPARQPE